VVVPGFEISHPLTNCSKRCWKIKMKEWKFEKNIPAREMSFMASKAIKRELEAEKETVFYRHGVLVDGSKVDQFKRQKLNMVMEKMDGQPMPGELDVETVADK
jgi:endogenous inhibitor of DNA gyrase (YacG/DUF329 family)